MIAFKFLISEGVRSLIRSRFSSAITIATITVALLLIGLGYIISRDLYTTIQKVKASFDLEVFLIQSITSEEIDSLLVQIRRFPEVDSIRFISKEEAAKRFKKEFGEDIFDLLGVNPLPASFNLKLKPHFRTVTAIDQLKKRISQLEGIDEVRYQRSFILLLQRYLNLILTAGGTILLIILFSALFLVSNTIKLSIFAKAGNIEILKLLGARNSFIKAPFWIEGVLQGLTAAILADILLFLAIMGYNLFLTDIFSYHIIVDYKFYLGILISGILLGWVGSRRAIKRFLREKG